MTHAGQKAGQPSARAHSDCGAQAGPGARAVWSRPLAPRDPPAGWFWLSLRTRPFAKMTATGNGHNLQKKQPSAKGVTFPRGPAGRLPGNPEVHVDRGAGSVCTPTCPPPPPAGSAPASECP